MSMIDRGSRRLLVFTKPALPGRVKTRLIGDLSAHQAAELHAAFVGDLVERLAGGRFDLELAWALEEGEEVPAFDLADGRRLAGSRQHGADLGERLFHALHRAADSAAAVAVVGSDHPQLPLEHVHRAFELLEDGRDVVLGPAADGGYTLVACRRESLHRRLFEEVPWSTGAVLSTTLERCKELGAAVELLPPGADVDTPQDLERLARWLAERPAACPRTRELLAGWRLLPEVAPR